mmetsp:Transcript_70072/g.200819  ORF Transcript_70072/g.200819 Transcript_70072/m.200819 type:complete len:224 (+) Transcript_70072:497-1168(+)
MLRCQLRGLLRADAGVGHRARWQRACIGLEVEPIPRGRLRLCSAGQCRHRQPHRTRPPERRARRCGGGHIGPRARCAGDPCGRAAHTAALQGGQGLLPRALHRPRSRRLPAVAPRGPLRRLARRRGADLRPIAGRRGTRRLPGLLPKLRAQTGLAGGRCTAVPAAVVGCERRRGRCRGVHLGLQRRCELQHRPGGHAGPQAVPRRGQRSDLRRHGLLRPIALG